MVCELYWLNPPFSRLETIKNPCWGLQMEAFLRIFRHSNLCFHVISLS